MLADPQPAPDTITGVLSDVFEESQSAETEDQPETPRDSDEDEETVDSASEPEEDQTTKPKLLLPFRRSYRKR